MDYIKAGRGVVLTRWFHFAVYHKMVVTEFRANVPTVTSSPVATSRRVELFTNDRIVIWGGG